MFIYIIYHSNSGLINNQVSQSKTSHIKNNLPTGRGKQIYSDKHPENVIYHTSKPYQQNF
jgi:hypothetical protein